MNDHELLVGLIVVMILWAMIGVCCDRKGAATLSFALLILVMLS